MIHLKTYLIFLTSLILTILILPKLSQFATSIGLIDHPNNRKIHNNPKPLVGGIAMGIAFFFNSFLFIPASNLWGFYAGAIIILITGIIDDLKNLNCKLRFSAQILAALFMIFFSNTCIYSFGDLLSLGSISLDIFSIPVTVFCIVGVINAINMLDGLDGLAGGISFVAFISFAILASINNQIELMLLSFTLSGAVLGFLRYNWHPSKLFMGDCGSCFLGFTLAFLSIAITQKNNSLVPPIVPLLILAVPLVDAVIVMIKRKIKSKNPFKADKSHFHHILLKFGLSKERTEKAILLQSALFSSLGIFVTIYKIPEYYLFLIFSIYLISCFITSFYIKELLRVNIRMMRILKGWNMRGCIVEKLGGDKRRHPRYPLSPSFFGIIEKKDKKYSGRLIDIGFGGFSVRLNHILSKGESIVVNLILPLNGTQIDFSLNAEVVWVCREKDCYRYGFKFVSNFKIQKNILVKYLECQSR